MTIELLWLFSRLVDRYGSRGSVANTAQTSHHKGYAWRAWTFFLLFIYVLLERPSRGYIVLPPLRTTHTSIIGSTLNMRFCALP